MLEAEALHTAARRYCIERFHYWTTRYSEIVSRGADRQRAGGNYTPEALEIFPRYNIIRAIQTETERLNPLSLCDLDTMRVWLINAGESAEDGFTGMPLGEIAQRSTLEERLRFRRYIGRLSSPELDSIEPLPYRRVLTGDESKAIWSRFAARWNISESFWYPLAGSQPRDVVAFESHPFREAEVPERMRDILHIHGIERLWEMTECDLDYELDLSLFQPRYKASEGYWSSGDLDWIVYVSHESTVTIGGWLLDELKTMWPSWQAHEWNPST